MADFALVFADGADAYTFTNVTDFNPAFSRMQNIITALPGAHGGYDQYHNEEAHARVGDLTIGFVLTAADQDSMQALLDAVAALPYLGKRKLYYQPQGTAAQRWCWARVNDIRLGLSATDGLVFQPVTIRFDVPNPFWMHNEESSSDACSGASTALTTITNSGNAIALARIVVACSAAQTCQNPTIKRTVSGVDLDILLYTGTVDNSETLTFDAVRKSVDLDGTGVYSALTYEHPDWMRLVPGSNDLTVEFANGGDAATVTVYWSDTFRS